MCKFKVAIISISVIAALIYADMFAFGKSSKETTTSSSEQKRSSSVLDKRNNIIRHGTKLQMQGVIAQVGKLFLDGDFDKLEEIASTLRKEKARSRGGSWQLNFYYENLSQRWTELEPSREKWLYRMFDRWMKKKPNSATPRIAKAKAYIDFAWHARGLGYASGVTDEGWKQCYKKLAMASRLLIKAEALNSKDPEIYSLSIEIARITSKPMKEIESIFQKGIAVEPAYFPLYHEMSTILMPRWGGRKGNLEAFMDRAVNITKETEGESYYARIADMVYRYFKRKEFNETFDIPYDRIKKGYIDLIERYPETIYYLNSFCYQACYNGDYEMAEKLFDRIGDNWHSSAWRGSRKHFDSFKKKIAKRKSIRKK